MAPYRHPYRYMLSVVWASTPAMRRGAYAGGLGLLAVVAGVAIGSRPVGGAGALAVILGAFATLHWLIVVAGHAARLRHAWRGSSELGTVRRRRPQAGGEDPDLAHDEYAVTVQDDGWLVTWRLRPLAVGDAPGNDEVEVPGRPRYAAKAVDDRRFEPVDAARAAEQLVEAQERAAALEAAAAARAAAWHAGAAERAELDEETRATALALQRATGQRPRRD